MKKGDVIGAYVLTTDAREGGGHSQWAFAKKDGVEYFIKRFLAPTFPVPGGPGSEKTKAAKRARCEEFERHHGQVKSKLQPIAGDGGNLVITKEFFRDRAHYYKVTSKVDVSDITPRHIASMPRDDRILIMLTASRSLDTLHKAGLVHGDVKPENLLIKALERGFAIKVIDFDNCFPVHRPPEPDQLVGDPAYYSPELLAYILGETGGGQLDEKNDVFALGLVFWRYLTGAKLVLPDGSSYAAEAVREGAVLSLPRSVKDRPLADLTVSMLAKAPSDRPSMAEVHSALKLARRSRGETRPSPVAAEPPVKRGLRGKFLGRLRTPGAFSEAGFVESGAAEPADAPTVASPRAGAGSAGPSASSGERAGRLRGRLIAKTASAETGTEGEAEADTPASEGKLRGSLLKRKE